MGDYYSVDAFLAENQVRASLELPAFMLRGEADETRSQRLPCTFLDDLPDMGYLEGSDQHVRPFLMSLCEAKLTGRAQLAKNTTVELPFWLGLDIAGVEDR